MVCHGQRRRKIHLAHPQIRSDEADLRTGQPGGLESQKAKNLVLKLPHVDVRNLLTGSTSDSTSATDESTSSWRSLGEFLGQVFGGIVTVITLALGGLIKIITAVIWVVNAVKDAFVIAGTWIGETAAKIYLWFTETLPNAISSAIDTVVGFFRAIGQFFVGIGRWFKNLFRSIADGIMSFLQPVVDFFRGVGRAIKAVFDGIRDLVIRILRRIPDALLPASLERLKHAAPTECARGRVRRRGWTESTAARSGRRRPRCLRALRPPAA